MEKLLQTIDRLQDQLIHDVCELVKIKSVESQSVDNAPFGIGVKQALNKALKISEKLGFKTVNLNNYIGYACTSNDDNYICAIGHLDVVDEGVGWNYAPYGATINNGKIYGRGVLDNKGPILSCLYALYALKLCDIKLNYPIRIIFGCDEESGFEDIHYYLQHEQPPIMGFTPDCKYPVVYGERGRLVVSISSEVENLDQFFNYVNTYFLNAINVEKNLGIECCDEEFGKLEIKKYSLETSGNTARLIIILSYPSSTNITQLMKQLQQTCPCFKVEILSHYPAVKFDKDSLMVKALQKAYETMTQLDGTPVTTTGGTYAKCLSNIVPFGPSFPGQKGIGHHADEWMSIEDLMLNTKIYALALMYLNQLKEK